LRSALLVSGLDSIFFRVPTRASSMRTNPAEVLQLSRTMPLLCVQDRNLVPKLGRSYERRHQLAHDCRADGHISLRVGLGAALVKKADHKAVYSGSYDAAFERLFQLLVMFWTDISSNGQVHHNAIVHSSGVLSIHLSCALGGLSSLKPRERSIPNTPTRNILCSKTEHFREIEIAARANLSRSLGLEA
jgi:hypothetical protein